LKSSDYIITMLPNSQVVKGLVMNEEFLSSVNPNSIIIDSSTIDPSAAKEIYAYAKSKKRAFVDAPVSGGVVGAEKATLAFMVGADSPATFEVRIGFDNHLED
jgi:3-hydroxyisobutyrate dehydrogenase-like beta-hydroxyacid dehydrogenase